MVQAASQTNGISKHNSRNTQQFQGFVAALKDGFGFIETIDHDREVFFHFRYCEFNFVCLKYNRLFIFF